MPSKFIAHRCISEIASGLMGTNNHGAHLFAWVLIFMGVLIFMYKKDFTELHVCWLWRHKLYIQTSSTVNRLYCIVP